MPELSDIPLLLWSREDVGRALGISTDQVENLHRLGKLRGCLISARCLRWKPSDVADYVNSLAPAEGES